MISDSTADKLLDNKNKTTSFVKNRVFDLIAVGIVIAMTALSLGVVELREITWQEVLNILVESVPFYMAATLLSVNYYNKGAFVAKQGEKFLKAVEDYSNKVASLTGDALKYLPTFCNKYNANALRTLRETYLQTVAISIDEFEKGTSETKPLKILSKKKLKSMYDDEVVDVIIKCKKLKVKGIHPNILLSNFTNFDVTDLGDTEEQLHRKRFSNYALTYLVSILMMSLIAVKDVLQWGWMGAVLTLFKVLYIAIGAYMKYFNGYEDINVGVVNHINRKSDVLKEFEYDYSQLVNSKKVSEE